MVWWLGPAFDKPSRGFLAGWVVSLGEDVFVAGVGLWLVFCPYFENCIVDASIFLWRDFVSLLFVFVTSY